MKKIIIILTLVLSLSAIFSFDVQKSIVTEFETVESSNLMSVPSLSMTSFTAKPNSFNSIALTFSAYQATGYVIYRGSSLVTTSFVVLKDVTTGSYVDSGLTTDKAYYYRIRPYKYSGTTRVYGAFSNIISTTPKLVTVPTFTASVLTPSAIRVKWGLVSGVSGYELWMLTPPNTSYTLVAKTTGTEFFLSNLKPSITYSFRIRPYKISGTTTIYGAYSFSKGLTKPESTYPDGITGIYRISSVSNTNYYLNGYSPTQKTFKSYIVTAPSDGSLEQYFTFRKNADNSYTIFLQKFDQVLTVQGSIIEGASLISAPNLNSSNQKFNITLVENNIYKITPLNYPELAVSLTTSKPYSTMSHYFVKLTKFAKSVSQVWNLNKLTYTEPIMPVDTTIGGWFALTYENHAVYGAYQTSALDFNMNGDLDDGKKVYAIQSGTVVDTSPVIIRHTTPLVLKNGYFYLRWFSLYGHMDVNSSLYVGKVVTQGDFIGNVSNINATNNHLHFVISTVILDYNTDTTTSISPFWLQGAYSDANFYKPYHCTTDCVKNLIFRPIPKY